MVGTLDVAFVTVFGRSVYSGGRSDRAGSELGKMEEVTKKARACFMTFTLFLERGSRDAREAGRYGESKTANCAVSTLGVDEDDF